MENKIVNAVGRLILLYGSHCWLGQLGEEEMQALVNEWTRYLKPFNEIILNDMLDAVVKEYKKCPNLPQVLKKCKELY